MRSQPFMPDLIDDTLIVLALYRCASSAAPIGGFVDQPFALSCSIRRGCPLAPYLFLFFAAAILAYLRWHSPLLAGLRLPVSGYGGITGFSVCR